MWASTSIVRGLFAGGGDCLDFDLWFFFRLMASDYVLCLTFLTK